MNTAGIATGSFGLLLGALLLMEGIFIVKFERTIIPFPTRVQYKLFVLLIGKEKSNQWLSERTTPKELRSYAVFALTFGTALIFIGFNFIISAL